MKDSYSFDVSDEGLRASYATHRDAYIRVFDRLGLPYTIVAATSGAMGGSASEEFLAALDAGEDNFVQCQACGYAANVEAARTRVSPAAVDANPPDPSVVETPGTTTIESLVAQLNAVEDLARADARQWGASDTLKNVLVMLTYPDGRREPLAIGLPGDRELDRRRLEAQLAPADAAPFTDDDFATRPELVRGYIGPGVLGAAKGIRYLLDPRVAPGTAWVTGADIPDRHVLGLVAGRDFAADGTLDAAEIHDGDACPNCGRDLVLRRGVEIGHIFQLGRKYADTLDLTVLGPDGRSIVVTMGSYGIGISRAVAALAEATLDHLGLCWPREVAPADAHVVCLGTADDVRPRSEQIVGELAARGVRVLHDDRPDASPGVKLKDAELIGIPTIVVIGKRLADGLVEVRDRRTGTTEDVLVAEVVDLLLALFEPHTSS